MVSTTCGLVTKCNLNERLRVTQFQAQNQIQTKYYKIKLIIIEVTNTHKVLLLLLKRYLK